MTRAEEIIAYANSFKGKGVENEELKETLRLAIIDGALWADEHPNIDAFIEKACETFCKVKCNDKPPRSTCTSLGTCFEHDKFRKSLKGE